MSRKEFSEAAILTVKEMPASVQHFAHFMMDYFVHVALWCDEHPATPVVVRDCGPCTPWFELLPAGNRVTVLPLSEVKKLSSLYPDNVHVMPGAGQFAPPRHSDRLPRFRAMFTTQVEPQGRNRVMATRSMSPSFYSSPESERRSSGPRRRRIGNEDRLARLLNRWWSFTVVEFFQLSPREAVTMMSSCSVFFAQRGAALMNLLFMPPGATVIEVLPQEFSSNQGHADLYRRACGHLGLRYMRIMQKSQFARVAPLRVVLVLAKLKIAPNARWPVGSKH